MMKTEALLVQASYGDRDVSINGLNVWYVTYDGTIKDFQAKLQSLQEKSEFIKIYDERTLNPKGGSWLLFSVIHRETIN